MIHEDAREFAGLELGLLPLTVFTFLCRPLLQPLQVSKTVAGTDATY